MTPVVDLAQRNTIRLIPTGRLKPPVLSPLAADDSALDDLAALESATNGRLRAQHAGLTGLNARELVFGQPNSTFVNAAFTHTRPGGNRFNGEARGAWYCAFDADTALGEVAYHLTRELENVGRFENVTGYAELIADFIGPFHDVRSALFVFADYLRPEREIAYPAGQAFARELRTAGSNGIVYPSARRRPGTCLVAFHPSLVQNLRQGSIWRLTWSGSPVPDVTKTHGRDGLV